MVFRPILTYGSTVWWPRVGYNVSRTELSKFQRLPCLAITGVMKTTPTATMEVFLGLLPLHVITEAEAHAWIYRLMCNQQWILKSTNYGHAKKSRDIEHEPILLMGTEKMIQRYAYHKPFKVQRSSFLTSTNGRTGFTQIIKEAWSGTWMGPRLTKALVSECTNGARKRGIDATLGSTPRYSRRKYMPLRHA